MKSPIRSLLVAIGLSSLSLTTSATSAGHELSPALPCACNGALPVELTPSLTLSLGLMPAWIGVQPQGLRANIYVTGGTLQEVGGPLSGTFQAVGADWFNVRRDGVLEVELVAPVVQTNNGTFAQIRQKSRSDLGPDGFNKAQQFNFPNKLPMRAMVEFGTALGSTIERFNAARLLGVGYVQPSTLTAKYDAIYALGEQTDASYCSTSSPLEVQYITSFKLKAWDMTNFTKPDGDQAIQYTFSPGIAVGPDLAGVVIPGATLRAKVHPDGVADVNLQATLRTASGEALLINSEGRANFAAQGGLVVPLRIQSDVQAEGTKFNALNRDSMLLIGEVRTSSGEIILHLYRMPVTAS